MKKGIILSVVAIVSLFFGSQAQATTNSVEDNANLFTADEIVTLNEEIADLNEKSDAQLFIVTTNTDTGFIRKYADDYLRDKIGNNNNGAVLVIDMNQRDLYISTSGNVITALTDNRLNNILDNVQGALRDNNYYDGALDYIRGTRKYFVKEVTLLEGIIGGVIALVVALAFFFTTMSRYQLKMGGYSYSYHDKSSLNLETQTDQLVNSYVTTRRIPRNNNSGGGFGGGSSTHSSGGGTFGGGGRSF